MPARKKAVATKAENKVAPTPATLSSKALETLSESAMDRALAQVTAAEPPAFISIDKRGRVTVGRKREVVGEDELFLWHPLSAQTGYICWKDGRPVEEAMVSVFDDPVNPEALADHGPYEQGDGWREQVKLTGDRLTGGQRVVFSPTSFGGRKTVGALLKQALLAMKEQGRKDLLVVGSWKLGSYDHQKYGEVLTCDLVVEAIVPEEDAIKTALDLMEAKAA